MAGFSALAFLLFVVIAFRSPLERVLLDTSASVFGLLYIGFALVTIPLIWAQEHGPSLLLLLFCVVWSGDIAALYVGRSMGRRKLAPKLSPGKTWEGSIASVGGSLIVTVLLVLLGQWMVRHNLMGLSYEGSWAHWLVLAVVLNIAAQIGDLVESALKRGAKVKDSGSLLPRPWRGAGSYRCAAAGGSGAVVCATGAAVVLESAGPARLAGKASSR